MAYAALNSWRVVFPAQLFGALHSHFFENAPGEHAALLLAGFANSDRGPRLIVREVHKAIAGVDYVRGATGYQTLSAGFIQRIAIRARDERLCLLTAHNHGGDKEVAFSSVDRASHVRNYPTLVEVMRGMPMGAVVLAKSAMAGTLWVTPTSCIDMAFAIVVGETRQQIFAGPQPASVKDPFYDRQSRVFGDRGQSILGNTRVGIVGLGGAGSILAELLGRLGVGEFLLCDHDRVEASNLPRLLGARASDANGAGGSGRLKVDIAARNILRANPCAKVERFPSNFLSTNTALRFTDCDYLFLAADSMSARLLFNAIVQQYGIPGVQVGSKVCLAEDEGEIRDVYSVVRPVLPGRGCLWCNGLISSAALNDESQARQAVLGRAYVADSNVVAPSVVTLNAIAAAHAANSFLFHVTGLADRRDELEWFRWKSLDGTAWRDLPRVDSICTECSAIPESRFARGDCQVLPLR